MIPVISYIHRRFIAFFAYFLWVLLVLYPNPMMLVKSIPNAMNPDIDTQAVASIAKDLPNDPTFIEKKVNTEYVKYAVPWELYGVPWYFPTTEEVLRLGKGDCQGRMLVLASILKAKGIPYSIEGSLDHIWVQYPKKLPNPLENDSIVIARRNLGTLKVEMPKRWDWKESYRIEKEYFWDPMPTNRKIILFGGILVTAARRLWLIAIERLLEKVKTTKVHGWEVRY